MASSTAEELKELDGYVSGGEFDASFVDANVDMVRMFGEYNIGSRLGCIGPSLRGYSDSLEHCKCRICLM